MATAKCGWCGASTHMTEFGLGMQPESRRDVPYNLPDVQGIFSCDHCARLSVASYFGNNSPGSSFDVLIQRDDMQDFWRQNPPSRWSPEYVTGQDYEDVPEHIAKAAGEAHRSASIDNNMSAILMARTVIEATAKEKGITTGNLQGKIVALEAARWIRPHVKESADEIRHFGNDMAHGDIIIPVEKEDVEEVLALMDEILNEVYQSHARLAKVQARREARKAKDAG